MVRKVKIGIIQSKISDNTQSNIILAINKMDLIHYKENGYLKIVDDYKKLVSNFDFKKITSIPANMILLKLASTVI